MKLPRLKDYLEELGALVDAVRGESDFPIAGAANDSRKIKPGYIFIAICGADDDGHRYLDRALAAGARAVISERDLDLPAGVTGIRVHDAYAAAGIAAAVMYGFPAAKLELIGITGTNGKTTTAFLLRDILAGSRDRVGLLGTVGYDCGVGFIPAARTTPDPFVLQELFAGMVANGCRRAVLEVSSHALAQHRLGRTRFKVAVFTNLSGDHLDYHHDMENYFLAKRRLFADCLAPGGRMVVNGDDAYGRRLRRQFYRCRPQVFSRRHRVGNWELRIVRSALSGQVCQLTGRHAAKRFFLPLVGAYNAENLAAAVLAARLLKVGWSTIAKALRDTRGVPGRLQAVSFPNRALALVDYAHTDDALAKVIRTLRELPHRKLVVLFGCGGDRDRSKRPRMARAAARADYVMVTTDNPRNEDPGAIVKDILAGIPPGTDFMVELDRRRALEMAVARLEPGDILLVAGKGHEDYQEIKGRRFFFDDRLELERLRRDASRQKRACLRPANGLQGRK